jgi:hypothetical protein
MLTSYFLVGESTEVIYFIFWYLIFHTYIFYDRFHFETGSCNVAQAALQLTT